MAVISVDATSATLTLNGYAFSSFAEGDFITLAFPNPHTSRTNSAGGGVSIQERIDGGVCDMTVRVQKYSDDDVFMNTQINSGVIVFDGSLKEAYTKDGSDASENFSLGAGSITTKPTSTKNNQDGNAMLEYVIQFRDAKRLI